MYIFWTLITFTPLAIILIIYLRGKLITDNNALIFGLSFYCFLPFFAYGSNIYSNGPGAQAWIDLFEPLYYSSVISIIYIAFLILAFISGKLISAPILSKKLNKPISKKVLKYSAALLLFILSYYTYQSRHILFKGYSSEYDASLMGPLATVNLITTLILLNIIQWKQGYHIMYFYLSVLLINSLLLLSMGGRMYVLTSAISLLMQHVNSVAKSPKSRIKILGIIFLIPFIMLLIGVWRSGDELTLEMLAIFGLAEPLLTSISIASLYNCENFHLFRIPYNFLSSILNFIPSSIFSNKAEFIISLGDISTCLNSPFGATNIIASLYLNFGIIGSAIFIFLFSILLKSIKLVNKDGWWLYYYVCGLLPFIFFRDGFTVFNKVLFFIGFFTTVVILILSRLRIK
jgi:oligosaccharide repeat unit polymerase